MNYLTSTPATKIAAHAIGLFIFAVIFGLTSSFVNAQYQPDPNKTNPNSSSFMLVACDGPELPQNLVASGALKVPDGYPCNFRGLMIQANHLVTIMLIFGVFAAIAGFVWAGFLYITGGPNKKDEAKGIFAKIGWGFIIMMSAWFIVYQLVTWLAKPGQGFTTLLGSPQ